MSTELCACANLDWSAVDMSAAHHPACGFANKLAALDFSAPTAVRTVSFEPDSARPKAGLSNPATAQSWGEGGYFAPGMARLNPDSLPRCACGNHPTERDCDLAALAAGETQRHYFRTEYSERQYAMPDPNRDECLVSGLTICDLEREARQGVQAMKRAAQAETENRELRERIRELEGRIANALL
jgi:hypothetical protein